MKRYLWAVLVACLLALVIGKLHARELDEDRLVIYYPGICDVLEPYTFWWGFFGCENRAGLVAETATYQFRPDGRVIVEIVREFQDGQRVTLIRELKGR